MPRDSRIVTISGADFQQTLENKLADLPPLPAVVMRIMQMINDPDVTAEDINRVISLDPGLSSKILRIVNSAYYGFPKRISTITHAVVILGFNTVRNLVLGVSAFGLLSQRNSTSGLNRRRTWEHSISTAVAASTLTRKRRPKNHSVAEEAFICGLLHDIGKLFLDAYFPVQYGVTLSCACQEKLNSYDAEQAVLEVDHAVVGRRIAEQWNFPPLLTASIGAHHELPQGSPFYEAAAILQIADWMAWEAGVGSLERAPGPPQPTEAREWLGFSDEDFDWTLQECASRYGAACDLLQLYPAA